MARARSARCRCRRSVASASTTWRSPSTAATSSSRARSSSPAARLQRVPGALPIGVPYVQLAGSPMAVLVVHGADDPRTEPDELARFARAVPGAVLHVIAGAGHAPHSERAAKAEVTEVAASFLRAG
ncbi:MAG: alpha/beta fold hydrolase [Myxococcales bacterium]|nr:alpha/beta fold hydrolase [Myxococcales bacterium]